MNVSRLIEYITALIALEDELGIQTKLDKLSTALANLVSNPQDAGLQASVATALGALGGALKDAEAKITPAQRKFLSEIGYEVYFSGRLVEAIASGNASISFTPAVMFNAAQAEAKTRNDFVTHLNSLIENFEALNIEEQSPAPGQAEIGFVVPRDIFDNRVRDLAEELRDIDFVVAIFSEALGVSTDNASLSQLSTSDPSILIGAHTDVVLAIGATVTFLLETYKRVLELKKLRQETQNAGMGAEVLKQFDEKVSSVIKEAIQGHTASVLGSRTMTPRDNELSNGLDWAQRFLLSRMERGMTVEVRFLPPEPSADADNAEEENTDNQRDAKQTYERLRETQLKLEFGGISEGQPLLSLTAEERPDPPKSRGGRGRKSTKKASS